VLRVHFKKVRVVQGRVSNRVLLNIPSGEGGVGEGGTEDRTLGRAMAEAVNRRLSTRI
jgi:hypothetical protein